MAADSDEVAREFALGSLANSFDIRGWDRSILACLVCPRVLQAVAVKIGLNSYPKSNFTFGRPPQLHIVVHDSMDHIS